MALILAIIVFCGRRSRKRKMKNLKRRESDIALPVVEGYRNSFVFAFRVKYISFSNK